MSDEVRFWMAYFGIALAGLGAFMFVAIIGLLLAFQFHG
jgi:hypothetical protein